MKNLILFTATYPYGNGETFITDELSELSKTFDHVYLIPLNSKDEARKLPTNCTVIKITPTEASGLKSLISVLNRVKSGKLKQHLSHIRYLVSSEKTTLGLRQALINVMARHNLTPKNTILYSYWMDRWVNVICGKEFDEYVRVSRAHGYDLYDYRHPWKFIPFRHWQLNTLSRIYPISENGKHYLIDQHPNAADKIEVARLCSGRIAKDAEPKPGESYKIVSCSSLIPLKRVDKIPEVLNAIESLNIEWVHFGDGPEKGKVQKAISELNPRHSSTLKGHVSSDELHEYYANHYIDLFLNLSKYEGIPVSIMEAISYGIPAVAPDVGGINEIISDKTGRMVSEDIDTEETSRLIVELLETCSRNKEYRSTVQMFWKENYSIDNHVKFSNELGELLNEG